MPIPKISSVNKTGNFRKIDMGIPQQQAKNSEIDNKEKIEKTLDALASMNRVRRIQSSRTPESVQNNENTSREENSSDYIIMTPKGLVSVDLSKVGNEPLFENIFIILYLW